MVRCSPVAVGIITVQKKFVNDGLSDMKGTTKVSTGKKFYRMRGNWSGLNVPADGQDTLLA